LKGLKNEKESFSDVIRRITKTKSLSLLAGLLTKKEGDELKKNIEESRKHSKNRADKIRGLLQ